MRVNPLLKDIENLEVTNKSQGTPIIGSCSGFGGLLVGNGPVQWAFAGLMVLAACTGLVIVAKR
ncbi:glutamine amidotransferase PdxT, partial [Bartonella silvatica]